MLRTIDRYEEKGLGLPYPITLFHSVTEFVDAAGKAIGKRIPNLEGLCAAVAITRCLYPAKLNGAEVRFLRHTLCMTQQELADAMELEDKEVISEWENSRKGVVAQRVAEKLLRALVVIQLRDKALGLIASEKDIVRRRIVEGLELPPLEAEVHDIADGVWKVRFGK